MQLFRAVISWIGRYGLLVVIVALMAAVAPRLVSQLQEALREFDLDSRRLSSLRELEESIRSESDIETRKTNDRLAGIAAAGAARIQQRILAIDAEIRKLEAVRYPAPFSMGLSGVRIDSDSIRDQAIGKGRMWLLIEEKASLLELQKAILERDRSKSENARSLRESMERSRREHADAYRRLRENESALVQLNTHPLIYRFERSRAWEIWKFSADEEMKRLTAEHETLLSANQKAFNKYRDAKQRIAAPAIPAAPTAPTVLPPSIERIAAPLAQARAMLEDRRERNWLGRELREIADDAWNLLPWAFGVVAGIILTPIALRSFLYFVLAPLASRRPAIAIMPTAASAIARTEHDSAAHEPQRRSAASCALTIDATNELLVHPQYIKSSPHESSNVTEWFLSRKYWLASMAAGQYLVTRMRSDSPATVVVSVMEDALYEVAPIDLPAGSAIVLLPRHLVAVLQERDRPLEITSHWRLASLHAWLTLQLRFLVFHGPVTLIVKGCRGVRQERASSGRSIAQAATIGFGAQLGYASRRCETFMGYLRGKQPLLNDSFVGPSGDYIYQEVPAAEGRSGVTGRGLEGFMDAVLKVFGV